MNEPVAPSDLARNLRAGARLVFFRRVAADDFTATPPQFVALAAFVIVVGALGAFVRNGVPGHLDLDALPTLLGQFALVLLAALAVAQVFGRPDAFLPLASMLIAGDPVFEVVATALHFAGGSDLVAPRVYLLAVALYLVWGFATMVRALRIAVPWRRPQGTYAVGILAAMFAIFVSGWMRAELWVQDDAVAAEEEPELSVAQEQVFHRQQTLLDERLDDLAPERPGEVDLYFLGVAPYGLEDVFSREMTAVHRLFDERFGTAGRSLVLSNAPATLAETPIATVTQLRYALAEIATIMNPDEDVLFLFLSSHGEADHRLAFELPPLVLDPLTPTALARMLHDAGLKWRVVVVSACYSGGFLAPLADAGSLVITAADADRSSFGCAHGNDFTHFGRAFFDEALRETRSFPDAFEAARLAVDERERREGLTPSRPQIAAGAAIRDRLAALEARLR